MGNVTFHKIDYTTDHAKWLEFRTRGVGASDVSTILGYNEYQCNLELFYEKIGMPTYGFESLAALVGLESEDMIAMFWSYWQGTERSIVENKKKGNIIRQFEDIKAYAVNSDMPYLFASMDRKILKYGTFNTDGALELKNTQRTLIDRYEDKIVPAHLIQNLVQIFTANYEFGEIAYFLDNKSFHVVQLHDIRDYGGLIEQMKSEVTLFWECVVKGRKLYTERIDAEHRMLQRRVMEIDNEIAKCEPPVQNTPVYLQYLSEKFKNRKLGINTIKGDTELYKTAKTHKEIKMQIEELKSKLIVEEITLKNALGANSKMEFGKGMGYVSWATSINGARPFLNKVA